MNTTIVKCNCASEYQDDKYGKNKRVANRMMGKGKTRSFRCTICNTESEVTV